jgi:hypothetical protein
MDFRTKSYKEIPKCLLADGAIDFAGDGVHELLDGFCVLVGFTLPFVDVR